MVESFAKYRSLRVFVALALVAVSVLYFTPADQAQAAAVQFKDVAGHWAEDEIAKGVEKGFINGYPDGTFRPDDRVNVDEFVKIVVMSLFEKDASGYYSFSKDFVEDMDVGLLTAYVQTLREFNPNDIPKGGYWAQPYLDQAERMLFFNKNSPAWGGKFDVPLTREKAAYIVALLVNAKEGVEEMKVQDVVLDSYKDAANADYSQYIADAILKGVMVGKAPGQFKPHDYVTRAEAVTIANRITDRASRPKFTPDFKGKYYAVIKNNVGDDKYVVFDSKETLDILKELDSVKQNAPGYNLDNFVSFYSYPSKQEYEKYVNDMLTNPVVAKYPGLFYITVSPLVSGENFFIGVNTQQGIDGYEDLVDIVASGLFGDQAVYFKDFLEEKVNQHKNGEFMGGNTVINNREVFVYENVDGTHLTFVATPKRG